jgi:hypothetical protein
MKSTHGPSADSKIPILIYFSKNKFQLFTVLPLPSLVHNFYVLAPFEPVQVALDS